MKRSHVVWAVLVAVVFACATWWFSALILAWIATNIDTIISDWHREPIVPYRFP